LGNGKRSQHLKVSELSDVRTAIAIAHHIQILDRSIAWAESRLARAEKDVADRIKRHGTPAERERRKAEQLRAKRERRKVGAIEGFQRCG
jgi:hypothetical protein